MQVCRQLHVVFACLSEMDNYLSVTTDFRAIVVPVGFMVRR